MSKQQTYSYMTVQAKASLVHILLQCFITFVGKDIATQSIFTGLVELIIKYGST